MGGKWIDHFNGVSMGFTCIFPGFLRRMGIKFFQSKKEFQNA